MKRKIKFKAWHKKEKKLCRITTLNEQGAFLKGIKCGEDTIYGKLIVYAPKDGRFCKNKEFILMQYIGLKDINGKEIYEGDIVKWGHKKNSEENPVRVAIVEINPDIQFRRIDEGFFGNNYIFHFGSFAYKKTEKALEIIGNIYENSAARVYGTGEVNIERVNIQKA